ncbi:MAG: hypothetical protein ABMA14_10440 [Hyphomonadaceae bacterium]
MIDDNERHNRRTGADPFGREAKRAAWRARRAARHAGRGDWSHFGDPKFWGLDAESMKHWGFGGGMGNGMHGMGMPPSAASVAELEDKVARMEKTIASLNERIIVLERLALNDEARLAADIERLRDTDRKQS